MAKKANGEGTISKRKNGKYIGQVSVGRNSKGKLIRKTVYGNTKLEVVKKMAALQNEVFSGVVISSSSEMNLKQWLNNWFEVYKMNTLREQTQSTYKMLIQKIIVPKIGSLKLTEIKPITIQNFINELNKYSNATIVKIKNILNPAFKTAVSNKLMSDNPFVNIQISGEDTKEVRALTKEELIKFENAAKDSQYYACFITAIDTGLRVGELLALSWNDIDFVRKQVKINKTTIKSYKSGKETIVVQELPKTKSSIRTVPLTSRCIRLLKELKLKGVSKEIVFCSNVGTYIFPDNLRRSVKVVCKHANITSISIHMLRHTFATRLFNAGVAPKIVSELLGHSKIQITLDTYITITEENKEDAIKLLEAM